MEASRTTVGSAVLLAAACLMTSLAVAQPADSQAPIAVPRAQATRPTATAPATMSAEEALWLQILALRQMPQAPAGTTQPLEDPAFVQRVNQQLEKSLALTEEYLKKYPQGEHVEQAQIQRLDTIRLQAVVNRQPFDRFESEARKVLASNASTEVKAAAEYMLLGIQMEQHGRSLVANQQMTDEQKDEAWRQAVVRQARQYIDKYPRSVFAQRFYSLLIEAALQDRDFDQARGLLVEMRAAFPESPIVAELDEYIQTAAAATQAAATQPAATQPSSGDTEAPVELRGGIVVPREP